MYVDVLIAKYTSDWVISIAVIDDHILYERNPSIAVGGEARVGYWHGIYPYCFNNLEEAISDLYKLGIAMISIHITS